jgi:hypothetical protein
LLIGGGEVCDGVGEGEPVGPGELGPGELGPGVGSFGTPVHAVPFIAKLVGAGLLPVQDPLKPNEVLAPVARLPL